MIAEFANGYSLEVGHYPQHKKPLLVLRYQTDYMAHAVFKDEDSAEEFMAFMKAIWGKNSDESFLEEQ